MGAKPAATYYSACLFSRGGILGDSFFMASHILNPAWAKELATHCHSECPSGYLLSETGVGERSPIVAIPHNNSFIF